jgi:hypothetical protein
MASFSPISLARQVCGPSSETALTISAGCPTRSHSCLRGMRSGGPRCWACSAARSRTVYFHRVTYLTANGGTGTDFTGGSGGDSCRWRRCGRAVTWPKPKTPDKARQAANQARIFACASALVLGADVFDSFPSRVRQRGMARVHDRNSGHCHQGQDAAQRRRRRIFDGRTRRGTVRGSRSQSGSEAASRAAFRERQGYFTSSPTPLSKMSRPTSLPRR